MGTHMYKIFEYKNRSFYIGVELNVKVERTPNGRRWHTIKVNDNGVGDYRQKYEVEDSYLIDKLKEVETDIIKMMAETDRDKAADKRLYDLGFR